jgi:Neuraminidase (sialidase)
VKTVSAGTTNDKELMWIDTHASSPFKDRIYVVWDVPNSVRGGMRVVTSGDKGKTWSHVITLSNDRAIGSHITTGPAGEVYVAWPDTASQELRIRKSTDGGKTFQPVKVIAKTNKSYEISIPAMCQRNALIYLSLGVDRSSGPRKGWVYATWTDRNNGDEDPGCAVAPSSTSNTNIYFSRSKDGGSTWSAPRIIHSDIPNTDQFNQWMDVDASNGVLHAIFYDTRDDADRKKTNLYYVASKDGGDTWSDESRITNMQTDETVLGAELGNQYGDYNGLVAFQQLVRPVWTDRRVGTPGGKEQIYTAKITSSLVRSKEDNKKAQKGTRPKRINANKERSNR